MNDSEDNASQNNIDGVLYLDNNERSQKDINDIVTYEDINESSLLNSIVEAVMRGDMNQVVTLALSHRNIDSRDKGNVDDVISSALKNRLIYDQNKNKEGDLDIDTKPPVLVKDNDVDAIEITEISHSKKDSIYDLSFSNSIYSTTMKSSENNNTQCSYYIDSNSMIESSNNLTYCQSGFQTQNIEHENQSEDLINGHFTNYQTSSSINNSDNINSTQQSLQVQLPGIGNFLLQIPSNLKPGEPITLPINLPLTPVSQTSGGNPISINMNTGQLISNQLLSLYHPSSCMNNITIGRKMRAIAPKPSYRQPLIAPKTNSPSPSVFNQDCNVNSTPLPAPTGPGRRKGAKGKKVGRKRRAPSKSRKDSSYASSTHSIDSQDATQFNEPNNSLKQNCNNFISSRNTYPCNYFVNTDSSDYINQSHVVPQSYSELNSNNLIDASDSGEKDLLSLAWEISNADLGNNDDFSGTYQLYDNNNLSSESFVSSEILDQFLQNIQKDDISEMTRCSSNQINLDQRVSYAASFATLPPCSTVLPSVTTSNFLNNSSNNQSNLELSQCIEIAEVVNLNTEDMLSELEKEENALIDKFVAQYSSNHSDSLKCDTHIYSDLNSSTALEIIKYLDSETKMSSIECRIGDSEKDTDPTIKESNELSEIAKQIEKDCDELHMGNYTKCKEYQNHCVYDYQNQENELHKSKDNALDEIQGGYDLSNPCNICKNVTTPLGLIYSTSTDSLNSTIVDCQNQYIVSVNMDNQRQHESTFYLGDSSLQSKMLDDFGLFDFCTDEKENRDTDIVCVDDKKYLEPPILEDISDATPIPSDEESDDEDIDIRAFILSTCNHLPLYSDKMYCLKVNGIEKLSYSFDINNLHSLLDTLPLDNRSFCSDKWYINGTDVINSDSFNSVKFHKEEESKNINVDQCDITEQRTVSDTVCLLNEKTVLDSIVDLNSSLNNKLTKCGRYKKCKNNQILSNDNDRLSRLRKSQNKSASCHSAKYIESTLSSVYNKDGQISTEMEIKNDKMKIYNPFKLKNNTKVNHCTRSKGSISKSFDSFYEKLEKRNRNRQSKSVKTSHHLHHPKVLKTQKKLFTFSDNLKFNSLSSCDKKFVENLENNNNCDTHEPKLNEAFSHINDVVLCEIDKKCSNMVRKTSMVSRKYNLRRNDKVIECCETVDLLVLKKDALDKGYIDENLTNKALKNCLTTSTKLKKYNEEFKINDVESKSGVILELCNATIVEVEDLLNVLINSNLVDEQRITAIECNIFDLFHATIEMKHSMTSDIIKVTSTPINYEQSSSRTFPVRKINRKLRLLSGLEQARSVNRSSIIEFEIYEYLRDLNTTIENLDFSIYSYSLVSSSECKCAIVHEMMIKTQYHHFETNDDDFDDGASCDARLVIVENEEMFNKTYLKNDVTSVNNERKEIDCELNMIDLPKRYLLRNKSREITNISTDLVENLSILPASNNVSRKSLKRSCKKPHGKEIISKTLDNIHDEICVSLKIPVCSLEKLTDVDLQSKLSYDCLLEQQNEKNNVVDCKALNANLNVENDSTVKILNKTKFLSKFAKKVKKSKSVFNVRKKKIKYLPKRQISKSFNYATGLKDRLRSKILSDELILNEHLELIENRMAKIHFNVDRLPENNVDNEEESIEVNDIVSESTLCTYVDSNNVETFSRSYGSLSLKIKFQKECPISKPENKGRSKNRKRSSRKRKRLRHFLNLMRSNNLKNSESTSSIESIKEESDQYTMLNSRKRKHSIISSELIDANNQDDFNDNESPPPKLTPEHIDINDKEHHKPIRIKLFKSTGDAFTRSEEMVFSLQKNIVENKTENKKSLVSKMLHVFTDQPNKPCRQAANLAKKKIFSTAKEDRRSQNATLTSIWNQRKLNTVLYKLPTDFINSCNDRVRRPRGRPPKSEHFSLLSDKHVSSTGTLKLKIKLSKDLKNCHDDNLLSNGEISGRTSTNDSSILNSAVAGINGPSDALSLESNHFIDGITQELDDNIEYLEAKEAKVYFDPHQVDIEKVKNSYYSSKKNSSIHFDNESSQHQQQMYDDSTTDLCNKTKDILCIEQNFTQYIDNESSAAYNNNISKNFLSNNNISHLPKKLINVSETCYNSLSSNREAQDLSQSNQPYPFEPRASSPGKHQSEHWQSSKTNSSELLSLGRNNTNPWFSEHRSFSNSNILYDSYVEAENKEAKKCSSQSQNPLFIQSENEISDSKHIQRSATKRSSSKEGRKSSNNSFESHSQLSPNYSRSGLRSMPSQLNIHPWSDERNHNASINHTAAAWMTYAQQQAAAAAYMDPQMKAYYNLALSQSMLNNPYCGSYGTPVGNPENLYSSLHSQYLNNSKDLNEKNSNLSGGIRNHPDPMGTFMEAAQMSSWEHFYSAAAMAGYHNSSQGAMDDYNGFF